MYTNRNAIACGLSADSGLPGCMLWFSLVIGFLQKKCAENLEVMKLSQTPRVKILIIL